MTHRIRSPFARRIVGVLSVSAALAACSDDEGNNPDTGYDAGYDTGDVGIGDATTDTTTDVGPDTAVDVGPDTIADVTPDSADTTPDAADVTPDTADVTDTDTTDATDADTNPGPLEVLGTYDDNYGGFLRIAEEGVAYSWYGAPSTSITVYDNDADWAVGQNASTDPWNPDLWSKFEWVATEDGYLWCQTAFGEATEADAIAAAVADRDDADGGCGGFSWSVLTPGQGPIAVAGAYGDDYGGFVGVTGEGVRYSWYGDVSTTITQFDNSAEWAVGQNASTDPWNPDLWSKFEWAPAGDGTFYWCQTAFGAESEAAAVETVGADRTDWETGCGGFPWSIIGPEAAPLSIVGEYWDNYDGYVGVTAESVSLSWYGEPSLSITQFDNDAEWLVGQNSATDPWNPSLWSKIEWAPSGDGTFYWCQTVFGAENEEAAVDAAGADRTDWETGCGGFPWSVIDPSEEQFELIGSWTDNYEYPHEITADLWTQSFGETVFEFHIDRYSNVWQVMIAENGADNSFAPGKWSRFDWTSYEGSFWFCQQVYDADTPLEAFEADAADSTDPSTGGCGGGAPWSRLDD